MWLGLLFWCCFNRSWVRWSDWTRMSSNELFWLIKNINKWSFSLVLLLSRLGLFWSWFRGTKRSFYLLSYVHSWWSWGYWCCWCLCRCVDLSL